MSTLHAIGLRLAAVFMLLPLGAQARLYLDGPDVWYQGETITFVLKSDADTPVWTFAFGTDEALNSIYERFSSVLELEQNPVVADFVKTGWGACDDGDSACSFLYAELDPETFEPLPLLIPEGPVVTWQFWVRDDAELGPLSFDFDLKAAAHVDPFAVDAEPILWAGSKEFRVLAPQAVPEASTWILMIIGLAGLGARACRRNSRVALSRSV